MRVLVTGANGFIGIQVCRALLRNGHQVLALWHRSRERLEKLADDGDLQLDQGDILDVDRLREILSAFSPQGICHLAVQPPGDSTRWSHQVNVQGTKNLLEACSQTGIERLVFTSSMSVYNFLSPDYLPVDEDHPIAPLQPYGEEKRAGELLCQQWAHLHTPILRLSGIYGEEKRAGAVFNFTRAILKGDPVTIEQNRCIDLLHVADAADAIITALERAPDLGSPTLNIGAGCSISLTDLADTIGHQLGVKPHIDCHAEGSEFYLDISRARVALDFHPLPIEERLRQYIPRIAEELRHAT